MRARIINQFNEKYLYRWVGQAGLFTYFYGDFYGDNSKDMADYVLANVEMPPLPKRVDTMYTQATSYNNMKRTDAIASAPAIYFSVDEKYRGEPMTGDECVRIILDFDKIRNDLPEDAFLDFRENGENEVRILTTLKSWTKYVHKIEIDEYLWYNNVEDDYGYFRAIKNWFPKDFLHKRELVDFGWSEEDNW